ncbi:MAG: tetratricopeptide repeat protein [candidate division Zixibacteria bacterium]|nr:tetratricopeptide repeat protein [candidate division Zixibacteria bacterium]
MSSTAELTDRIDKCQRILDTDPNSQIFAALAEAFRKNGELDKAFRVCQSGLKVHPSYASAHMVMARINLDRGLYDWAEAEVRKAMEIEGPTRATDLLLAEIQIYQGDYDGAAKLLRRLLQADPNNNHIQKLLEIARKLPEERAKASSQKPGPPPDVPPPPGETRKATATTLSAGEILSMAADIPQVTGGLYVNGEGLVGEAEWHLKLDQTVCSATLAEVERAITNALAKTSLGKLQTLLIETGDPVFYLVRAGRGMFVFLAAAGVNLGTLRMKLSTLIDKFDGAH